MEYKVISYHIGFAAYTPDFILIEEVDKNATRSSHYDEEAALRNMLEGYDSTFTVNFDSPYLFYPLSKPHGKSYGGPASNGCLAQFVGIIRILSA